MSDQEVKGSYPGEGQNMSNYGMKRYTAEQEKEQWRESIRREWRCANTHTITSSKSEKLRNAWKVDCSPYTTGEKPLDSVSYFNTGKKSKASLTLYDRTFHIQQGYFSKLRRDDRQHTLTLDVYAEERDKNVPSLSSSQYGRRPALEVPSRKHVRVATVKRDFYRESGASLNT